jgi:hypothetical protein
MSTRELERAQAAYETAAARLEAARERRNQAVRDAIASGRRQVEVSEITGLSAQRVHQIRHHNQLAKADR